MRSAFGRDNARRGCLGGLLTFGRREPREGPGIIPIADAPITPGATLQNLVVPLNAADPVDAFRTVTVELRNTIGPLATPAGWIRIGPILTAGTAFSIAEYYRFRQAGDADSVTFVVSDGVVSVTYAGSRSSRAGVSKTWPVQDHQSVVFANTLTPTAPSATSNNRKSTVVTIIGADTLATYTPPAGMTERTDTGTTGLSLEIADKAVGTGATGALAATASASLANGVARTIILNPAVVADTTAPTVSLASTSTSVTADGSITLTATASDDQGIKEVRFYRNAVLIGTDTTSAYEQTQAFTTADNGTYSYTAVAEDLAGNTTTSNAVSVTVNIAAAPTLVARNPTVGALTSAADTATSVWGQFTPGANKTLVGIRDDSQNTAASWKLQVYAADKVTVLGESAAVQASVGEWLLTTPLALTGGTAYHIGLRQTTGNFIRTVATSTAPTYSGFTVLGGISTASGTAAPGANQTPYQMTWDLLIQ